MKHHLAQYNIARLRAPLDDPLLAEDLDSLFQYTYYSDHTAIFRRRQEFFQHIEGAYLVLWWVPAGHIPSVEEAEDRLDYLRQHGPTGHAFGFKSRFPAPAG